jgi:Uma2 family endonuclease
MEPTVDVSVPVASGLTYADLLAYPENDGLRRELIDGELFVSAAPSTRHGWASLQLAVALVEYTREHGGIVFHAPTDVFFSDETVLEPDVLLVTAEHVERVEDPFVRGAPDLVVEVASPSTRRYDLVRKRRVYEREGVAEFWFVDLESERVEVYRAGPDGFSGPTVVEREGDLMTSLLPGFTLGVAQLLRD